MSTDFITFILKLPPQSRNFVAENVLVITLPRKHQTCPHCGSSHNHVHDYRVQTLRGIHAPLTYQYNRRRYRCQDCGKAFNEENSFLSRYQRMPDSIIEAIIEDHKELASGAQIAHRYDVSAPTVMRHFARATEKMHSDETSTELADVLSIDEFRGNVGAKYQVVVNDLKARHCCAILKDRSMQILYDVFLSYPQEKREQIQLVSMDLSAFFRKLIEECFPNAIIAADKFHALRLANDALDAIRKDVQKTLDVSARKSFKNARRILLARKHTLQGQSLEKLNDILSVSDDLKKAHQLKEEYFELFSSTDHADYKKRLQDFAAHVAEFGLKEFKRVLRTTYQWQEEIWNGIRTGYNNGFTEGCNNTIKALKRVCYGFRNIENFKRRILFILNNPARQERRTKNLKKVPHNT
ncbi:ISL3 family transposase [uncultured Mitsuokella sp.]|uniref:ISL3 family transposase n=1 Tax=uncultured Mitsuokella sp. TaxID=453120 RepID=UPI002612EED4|nr:ISL3 family transposase [uncultured Mitsuokella sp.]